MRKPKPGYPAVHDIIFHVFKRLWWWEFTTCGAQNTLAREAGVRPRAGSATPERVPGPPRVWDVPAAKAGVEKPSALRVG